ncbi:spondin domain-containing protein [Pseudoalteromonas luteoviolacea]|uniref:spondin domain-containing protein n=1 Tax=Pseudoalteromonas luteoviolacea TaxID=43657 RepID=UPI001F1C28D2|nr:spondin domain-containing protein [Pseudoalteromonas luteoviolacea]MCF6439962.1 spondin domain-containing protein [Pseudoalteromonas luteoviolacea]
MSYPLKLAPLFMVLGLTACGGSSSSSPTNNSNMTAESSSTTSSQTSASTDSSTTDSSTTDSSTTDSSTTDSSTTDGSSSGDSSTDDSTTPPPPLSVNYELTFTQTWEQNVFPTNFPSNTHFSPLIGLTHNDQGRIFQRDSTASAGIVSMAETGSKTLLKSEISDIQNLGHSSYLIDEAGIPQGSKSVTLTFEASQAYPHLSIVSMVAPSPDWFIGIDSLLLFNDNQWIDEQTIQLKVYDAGSDNGVTFNAANSTTDPQTAIALLNSARSDTDFTEGVHFNSGEYIGFITIKRMQ